MVDELEYSPTPIPTNEEAAIEAERSPQYLSEEELLRQEESTERAGLGQQKEATTSLYGIQRQEAGLSYAEQRQQAINAYQDALDQINYGMRQVGIQTRATAAQRGLYEAGGGLSGIGQNVAAMAIEPLVRQTRILGAKQAQTMAGLTERERLTMERLSTEEKQKIGELDTFIQAIPTKYAQQKLDLRNQIVKAILDAAARRQAGEYDIYKGERAYQFDIQREAQRVAEKEREFQFDVSKEEFDRAKEMANMPGTRENQLKLRSEEQQRGRHYLGSIKEVQAAQKAGKHIVKVGVDYFRLSDKEELDLKNVQSQIADRIRKSTSISTTAQKDAIKKSYNEDLLKYTGIVQTDSGGPGKITREQLIQELAYTYPEFNPNDIAKDVYGFYKSEEERIKGLTPIQLIWGQR